MPGVEFTPLLMSAFDRSLIPPEPDLSFEQVLWQAGLTSVAGIDEAGRGALAGPVAAAAVILPPEQKIRLQLKGGRDSKQLTSNQRETVLVWNKHTGIPVYNAIVWQCKRTSDMCQQLKAKGYEKIVMDIFIYY